jgi:predicted RNase H-like nuclease (RuvC/YqgF family)
MSDKIAEIERLRAENERLRADNERLCAEMPVAEALRINAERLEMQRNDACGVIERQARKIVDLSASVERLRENVDRAGKEAERADRLRAEIARVKADEKKSRAEIERLTRERDEARYFLKIFVHAHASNNAVPPHLEEQARKALEGKP